MDEAFDGPVVVLGAPCSGVEVVAEALAGALAADESARARDVVDRLHAGLLRRGDRDWTCPPPTLDPDEVAAEDDAVGSTGLPDTTGWVVGDPLLLFTFGALAPHLDHVRLVAVVDDHARVVRALVEREGLEPGVAEAVASAHLRRLRGLSERFPVPLVDLAAADPVAAVVAAGAAHGLVVSSEQVATALAARDLPPGPVEVAQFDLDALRLRPEARPATAVAATAVAAGLADLAGHPADHLPRAFGPRAAGRRARAWSAARPVPAGGVALELVMTTRGVGGNAVAPANAEVRPVRSLRDLHLALAALGSAARIVLADLCAWVEPGQLATALALVVDHLDLDGVAVIGWSAADADSRAGTGRSAVTVDDLTAALDRARLQVVDRTGDEAQVVLRCVPRPTVTSLLRHAVERGRVLPLAGAADG